MRNYLYFCTVFPFNIFSIVCAVSSFCQSLAISTVFVFMVFSNCPYVKPTSPWYGSFFPFIMCASIVSPFSKLIGWLKYIILTPSLLFTLSSIL